ncbi:MAG TPA: bifunctional RNase H/acid phosphatase [Pseudonocardiaceae bacterium]
MTAGPVVVEADGGSRGNPGPAGYGAVVLDAASGRVLAERAGGLGVTTNNVAEYAGLIAGLRAAAELGATEAEVRMDSKLVVEQMSGRWQVRQPHLQPLVREARDLVRGIGRVRFTWIPRARNTRADRLANEAMDTQAGNPSAATVPAAARADGPPGAPAAGGADVTTTAEAATTAEPAATAEAAVTAGVAGNGLPMAGGAASGAAGGGLPVADVAGGGAPGAGVPGGAPAVASWTGVTGTPTRLVLVRHGQTEHSAHRRYSGRLDVPLTPLGERQAAATAARLSTVDGVAAVVSSPLRRCLATARPAAEALAAPALVLDDLTEADFGTWDGLTFAEAAARDPGLHASWLADTTIAPPGGESFAAVHRRVRRVRDRLVAEHPGRTVVVVSHVTPIKTLLRMALDAGPSLLFRLHLDLASVSVADFYPGGHATVHLVNDTSHLATVPA